MLYVMLVGAYPFERPEDKQDNQKLQKMIQVRVQTGLVGKQFGTHHVLDARGCKRC